MKTIDFKSPVRDYETPAVVCVYIDHEGVLCSSSEDFIIDEEWGDLM